MLNKSACVRCYALNSKIWDSLDELYWKSGVVRCVMLGNKKKREKIYISVHDNSVPDVCSYEGEHRYTKRLNT